MTINTIAPAVGTQRCLTDVFVTFRSAALQNAHLFTDSAQCEVDDKMALIPLHDGDSSAAHDPASGQPSWIHFIDEIQYEISKARGQMGKLKVLQQKHVSRPSFGDEISQEEHEINELTGEVTKTLNHANQLLHFVMGTADSAKDPFRSNVVTAHVQLLQELSSDFQRSQGDYMRKIQSREVSYQEYFDAFGQEETVHLPGLDNDLDAKIGDITLETLHSLEENAMFVKERELEIRHVSKSIMEVNQLFRDLATFVVDQGAVLDRIDCSVEFCAIRTRLALGSLKAAEKYQKRGRKTTIIFILIALCIILMLIIVIFKS